MKTGLLPIGTVVQLEGGTKKVMITGYYSKAEGENKIYQYNGCIFPEGFMENIFCLFDHNQIKEVFYKGLENDEYENYVSRIGNKSESLNSEKVRMPDGNSVKKVQREYGVKTKHNAKHPRSISEMRARYAVDKISGNLDDKADMSKFKR